MKFLERWVVTTALAFILFPILFVLWRGPDNEFGYVGAMEIMLGAQFMSPLELWRIPLVAGLAVALIWQFLAWRKSRRRSSD